MDVQLIKGQFLPDDAISIITEMIRIKIRYHEDKITALSNEEDIKSRESKIKQLQHELQRVRTEIRSGVGEISIDSVIHIQ